MHVRKAYKSSVVVPDEADDSRFGDGVERVQPLDDVVAAAAAGDVNGASDVVPVAAAPPAVVAAVGDV